MNKEQDIFLYSNPYKVQQKAQDLYLNPIHLSSRKDKKYMVFDGRKMVHFGQWGYEDFTKTEDEHKRFLFRRRNKKWADSPVYSPAFLSYYLLW